MIEDIYKLISEFLEDIDPETVLDLGCGEGRVSKFFGEKRARITGIDKKPFDIKYKNFDFVNRDIKEYQIDKKYGLIIVSLVLHFFETEYSEDLIRRIKENTKNSGYNFLVLLSEKDDFFDRKRFYPDLEKMRKLYSDWEIVRLEQDYTPREQHDNLPLHQHNIIVLLARKLKK